MSFRDEIKANELGSIVILNEPTIFNTVFIGAITKAKGESLLQMEQVRVVKMSKSYKRTGSPSRSFVGLWATISWTMRDDSGAFAQYALMAACEGL